MALRPEGNPITIEPVRVIHGDARMLLMADSSVDAIVCDPPYASVGGFMGKTWDQFGGPRAFQQWCEEWAREACRVLKPGGHMLAFGGSRTWHRLVCAVEDAGFEVRDSMAWLYGGGFPKSHDVSKAIDKVAGATREVVGPDPNWRARVHSESTYDGGQTRPKHITAPATDDARRWQGWGTALKPGFEPIVVARKPLIGTVAANVLQFGTGALNVDACRVAGVAASRRGGDLSNRVTALEGGERIRTDCVPSTAGRWPTNVILSHAPLLDDDGEIIGDACADGCVSGCPVVELDAQSGTGVSRATSRGERHGAIYGNGKGPTGPDTVRGHDDAGGASRFFPVFRYQAKAPVRERPKVDEVAHPTVKPLTLMRWLVRLVTPPGGRVLDMFAGSGTTGEAALLEGFDVTLVESTAEYLPLIDYRIQRAREQLAASVVAEFQKRVTC